ncbi:MAG: ankyrin repeat domain-containing protein [Kiritimatiellae bacterium]|nr:ankyrin repeat domain-containing protein [Kiritimatiellia bacterium]
MDFEDAVKNGDLQKAEALIKAGADVDRNGNSYGWKVLHYATLATNVPMMTLLIKSGADPNARDWHDGITPLHLAASHRNLVAVEALLALGASVNELTDENYYGAFGVPRQVNEKYSGGGSIQKTQFRSRVLQGATALHFAAALGDTDLAQLLLKHGADRSIRDSLGHTPAELAQENGHDALAEILESTGNAGSESGPRD